MQYSKTIVILEKQLTAFQMLNSDFNKPKIL